MSTLRQRRESTDEKAARLLTTGKLKILRMDSDFIAAECLGDTGTYELGYRNKHGDDPRWSCSCPARTDCAHLRALWLVTVNYNTGGRNDVRSEV